MPDNMDTFKSHLAQLFDYLQKKLQLKTVPKVKLLSDEKNADKVLGKTAYYNPDEKLVVLYITNRHQKDILRSFAHEIIHHWSTKMKNFNVKKMGRVLQKTHNTDRTTRGCVRWRNKHTFSGTFASAIGKIKKRQKIRKVGMTEKQIKNKQSFGKDFFN